MMEGVKVVVVVGGGYLGIASLFELWASGEKGQAFWGPRSWFPRAKAWDRWFGLYIYNIPTCL